tara:strand:- start:666 stop:863 length:198 start_codon:yes stop_codon:yes gene_type:complete
MSPETPPKDIDTLQKLADTIAELGIRIRGSVVTSDGDYEIETYIDEVVIENDEGREIVRAEIEER